MNVKIWTEKIVIPTYEVGKPDENPMFFEKRVYQGSSGVVYPNPIIEKIYDEKVDKEYQGVFLENKYLKIMILPELGGRVQMAYDKIKDRHFIYYNNVIKPALVGLCGPWISGGIEFNWPQHHRPSTFEPLEFTLEDNEDGSKTVWVNEVEKMFHTKCMTGFTLYADKAFLEIKAKLNNRTSIPQTFLWWANPAVKVHDHYQSIFPPDVNAVFDHGKRDVSDFPIATGTYYKVDYSPGTDISKYKNIPVPTSYMAVNSKYNFLGGYEHDIQAGMLHIADNNVSPGKKQWTWGNGDFGIAWDRNLTDEDGPYIELMAGVFTDNQPDFTWLKPFEEKTFTQYFLPYRELSNIKNASKDVLLNTDHKDGKLKIQLFATSVQKLNIKIVTSDKVIWINNIHVNPESVFQEHVINVNNNDIEKVQIYIYNDLKKEILRYNPSINDQNNEIPAPAKPALLPHQINNNEQLYLTGQHLEQYRHATYRPMPYYLEAIKRDPKDIRNNNAIGLWYFKKGLFKESLSYFKTAIETLTDRNPNPYNCEPYYNLGLALFFEGEFDDAYKALFKSAWDKSFQDAAFFYIAHIDYLRENYDSCLEHIDWALDRNARNGKAYVVKINTLIKLGLKNQVNKTIQTALERDAFNLNVIYEKYLNQIQNNEIEGASLTRKILENNSGQNSYNAIEYAIDFINIGEYEKAINFIEIVASQQLQEPLINYYLAFTFLKANNIKESKKHYLIAAKANPAYCFPNRLEDIIILKAAIENNPKDGKAHYYIGILYYDKQQYDLAINFWETASKLDITFPTVYRNLGLAYYNKKNNPDEALYNYEKAFSLNPTDNRVLMELDSLYKKLNRTAASRLSFLNKHYPIASQRDDLYLEIITLLNFSENYEKAYENLMKRKFHPWEGGEGKVSEQYIYTLVQIAKQHFYDGRYKQAVEYLEKAQTYPVNIGEGKLAGAQENDIFYWLGCSYDALDNKEKAEKFWSKATEGSTEPGIAMFYNDQQPDKIFYQGCAWLKLKQEKKANLIFNNLLNYADNNINSSPEVDYFAVSLPNLLIFEDDLVLRNKIHLLYISALGNMGLGNFSEAENKLNEVLVLDAVNLGAKSHILLIAYFKNISFELNPLD